MQKLVVVGLFACVFATDNTKKAASSVGYKQGYGSVPATGYQQPAPPPANYAPAPQPATPANYAPPPQTYSYPAPPPPPVYYPVYQPAPYALPNYDTNYCTVHASFPLVERRRKHHRRDKRQSYAPSPSGYEQSPPSYGAVSPNYAAPALGPYFGRSHRFERQGCRNAAIFSQAACDSCCKVSSRAGNIDMSEITGALFVFDPENFDRHVDRSSEEGDDEDNDNDRRVIQCVCCSPRRV